MQKIALMLLISSAAGCAKLPQSPSSSAELSESSFARLADQYIAGYLAWRPQTGTALGFHEYDVRLTDYSQRSLDSELQRLKSFEQKLASLSSHHLTPQNFYDYR